MLFKGRILTSNVKDAILSGRLRDDNHKGDSMLLLLDELLSVNNQHEMEILKRLK